MISRLGDFFDDPEEVYRKMDFSGVSFPSDKISIGFLRRQYAELFDRGYGEGAEAQPKFFHASKPGHSEDVLFNMLFCERTIVAAGYASARSMPPPDLCLAEFAEELSSLYVKLGIASGPHEAAQLIRNLESQGRQLGSGRGT